MDTPHKKKSTRELELQLVRDLESMRDSLTNLSLMLHDVKFLLDAPRDTAARALAADCIARNRDLPKGPR